VPPVPGRFEAIEEGQPFSVLVDFAHTPGALAQALNAARELANEGREASAEEASAGEAGQGPGRVVLVFGAGGDRDRAKRPLMGQVAEELGDIMVLTSDNPRSEQPLAIIEEVASGMSSGAPPLVDVDRARAIAGALGTARAGDVVLIAGKGHETGQDFGSHVEPFDDAVVAREALKSLGYQRAAARGNPPRVGAK
jgi:UDP-N-acetylmuramoyl-L-alanyl-D-glutamate--2,6-diaminopimelate ligase